MHVLVTCKNKEDPIKDEGARVFTRFLPLQVYGDFSRRSRAANWLSSLSAKMKKIRSKM